MGEVASPGIHLGAYQVKLLRPFINYASRCIAQSETHLMGSYKNYMEGGVSYAQIV